jgi:sugar-specific transcriptional regulator TrmB
MINEDSYTRALTDLGLTLLQSKIYLTLARVEKADVKIIAKYSNVARPDVYRVISSLEKMGLVEKIIDTPTKYKALSLKEGYSVLLKNQDRKQRKLKHEINTLLKNTPKTSATQLEDEEFVLISSKTLLQKRCLAAGSKVQRSIDVIGDKTVLAWFCMYNQVFQDALSRGVRIRIIAEKKDYDQEVKVKTLFLDDVSKLDIRYVDYAPIKSVLYDKKSCWLCIRSSYKNMFPIPVLMSNNPPFLEIMSTYFESIWANPLNRASTLAEYISHTPPKNQQFTVPPFLIKK